MNKHSFYALLFAAACSVTLPATAQKVKGKKANKTASAASAPSVDLSATYANTITQEDLRKHLSIIASDEYEGRETGEKGQKMAAAYIAKQFQDLGLTGPVQGSDNPYIQHFQLERTHWGDVTFIAGNKPFKWLEDFFIYGKSPFQEETTLQPVFVGYGIEQEGFSDYAGKDVKGKDVVMLGGEPRTKDGKSVLGADGKPSKWSTDRSAKMGVATQKGARSVITINPDAAAFTGNLARIKPYLQQSQMSLPSTSEASASPAGYAIISISPVLGAQLLGTTPAALQQYQADVTQAGKPVAVKWKPSSAKVKAPIIKESVTTENVLGYLEGTDKKDELLVCSAHYDHVGIIDGKVYNGADDDGSGTVSVLELAQAFTQAKKDGHGPRRSILFITVTGEEKGLLGSEYYTEHPVFPLASTIADLNIDMIGRIDSNHKKGDNYVSLVGSDKLSSELHSINETNNTKYTHLDLDYRYNVPNEPERIYYRSDHYNFAKHGIPVIFYTTGEHEDYHKDTDEVDKIEFPLMETRAHLVFHTAWELVNRDNRIVVDSNKP